MAPPEFNDIGKAAKDLLTKDFNFGKTKFEAKTNTLTGVEFNSLLERNDSDGTLKGELKTKFKHTDSGLTFTETYDTSNKFSVKVEATEIADGLKLDVEGIFNPYSASREVKVGYSFKSDSLTTTGNVNALKSQQLKVDAVSGYEGLLVGAQLSFDVASSKVQDYSLAVGYTDVDYAATFQANSKLSKFAASYSHVVSPKVTVAGTASWGTTDKQAFFEFGTNYKLDSDSSIKAKFDSDGKVGLGFSQKLRPDLKVSLGLLVNTRNLDQNAHKLGYSFTYEPK